MKKVMMILAAGTMLTAGVGCQTNTGKGAGIGAAVGGILGGVIGHQSGRGLEGAAVGAAAGGAVGLLQALPRTRRKTPTPNTQSKKHKPPAGGFFVFMSVLIFYFKFMRGLHLTTQTGTLLADRIVRVSEFSY